MNELKSLFNIDTYNAFDFLMTEINKLKNELSIKDKYIDKLNSEIENKDIEISNLNNRISEFNKTKSKTEYVNDKTKDVTKSEEEEKIQLNELNTYQCYYYLDKLNTIIIDYYSILNAGDDPKIFQEYFNNNKLFVLDNENGYLLNQNKNFNDKYYNEYFKMLRDFLKTGKIEVKPYNIGNIKTEQYIINNKIEYIPQLYIIALQLYNLQSDWNVAYEKLQSEKNEILEKYTLLLTNNSEE